MGRVFKHVFNAAFFDHFSGIHDTEPVTDPGHNTQVVRDKNDARVKIFFQIFDQFEHCRFNRYIQGSGGFVHDQKGRII